MKFFKNHLWPIILIFLGIINESTDLFVDFFNGIGAPDWSVKLFRILAFSFGAFKLYYTAPKSKNKYFSKDDAGIGGSNIPPNKDQK